MAELAPLGHGAISSSCNPAASSQEMLIAFAWRYEVSRDHNAWPVRKCPPLYEKKVPRSFYVIHEAIAGARNKHPCPNVLR